MTDMQPLYDLAPALELMALGIVIALGPLAWVWWRGRGNTPVRLSYRNADASVDVELGSAWRVRASHALADTLQNLDGVISAEIVFG